MVHSQPTATQDWLRVALHLNLCVMCVYVRVQAEGGGGEREDDGVVSVYPNAHICVRRYVYESDLDDDVES